MGRYDVTSKHLIEARPRDWLALAGFHVSDAGAVGVVDADLSVLTTAADKLVRVDDGPSSFLAHFEFQSGVDPHLDQRVMVYNVLGGWRHRLPVRSVVFLLRPEALASGNMGRFRQASPGRSRLDFVYDLFRVWDLPVDAVLAGGIGSVPLAPICKVEPTEVPAVIGRMRERFRDEASPAEEKELWAATRILMGLRYDKGKISTLLQGVANMKESVTYQEIVEEGLSQGLTQGRVEGRTQGLIEGERRTLIRLATRRFGPPDDTILARLNAIDDLAELDRLSLQVLTASGWNELLD